MNELKTKALQKSTQQNNPTNEETNTLIFPVHYFDGISDLKSLLHSLDNELKQIIWETRVIVPHGGHEEGNVNWEHRCEK